ncbi:MAG: T9SS type A sorting domain-containing protein [Bacteroidetes bacterium]|nr:T9SS type A sorting domain-containing protein [Bacteroidota bacterium]
MPWDGVDFNKETLYDPAILLDISLNASVAGDIVAVTIDVIQQDVADGGKEVLTDKLRLYTAVIESQVIVNSTGDIMNNVLRKFLPDAAGNTLVDANGNLIGTSFSETWRISDRVQNPDALSVIAFVQNSETKEIYQVVQIAVNDKDDVIVTGVDDELTRDMITIYPNPANDEVWVAFDQRLNQDFDFTIYNQVGMQISTGLVKQGALSFSLDTSRFPSGMYFLFLGNEERKFEHFKLVVMH